MTLKPQLSLVIYGNIVTIRYFGPALRVFLRASCRVIIGSKGYFLAVYDQKWNGGADIPMVFINGAWTVTLVLEPNREYEYGFLVDDEWMKDPLNPKISPNEFNNNVFRIGGASKSSPALVQPHIRRLKQGYAGGCQRKPRTVFQPVRARSRRQKTREMPSHNFFKGFGTAKVLVPILLTCVWMCMGAAGLYFQYQYFQKSTAGTSVITQIAQHTPDDSTTIKERGDTVSPEFDDKPNNRRHPDGYPNTMNKNQRQVLFNVPGTNTYVLSTENKSGIVSFKKAFDSNEPARIWEIESVKKVDKIRDNKYMVRITNGGIAHQKEILLNSHNDMMEFVSDAARLTNSSEVCLKKEFVKILSLVKDAEIKIVAREYDLGKRGPELAGVVQNRYHVTLDSL